MNWISVKDRLPENEGRYLVACGWPGRQHLRVEICYLDSTLKRMLWTGIDNVTHWMPLPPPPEEK